MTHQTDSSWRAALARLSRRSLFSAGTGVVAAAAFTGDASAAAAVKAKATYTDNIYTRMFGVRPVVGAFETLTSYGNSRVSAEVLDAMREANEFFVDMHELNAAAGKRIAEITGAESAMVVASSSAGMMLSAAACVAGADKAKIDSLPQITWPKREVLMQRGHRFSYDRNYTASGAIIVTVDSKQELINAISERTAMIAGLGMTERAPPQPGVLSIPELVEIARNAKVPLHIDGAGEVSPVGMPAKYIAMGADLVNISGSKYLQGPGATGILAGRKDLIDAAIMIAAPNQGVGRSAKVGKAEIVGMMVALEQYLKRDHAAEIAGFNAMARRIADGLKGVPGLTATLRKSAKGFEEVEFSWDQAVIPLTEQEVRKLMLEGEPRIAYMSKIIYAYNGPTLVPALLRQGEDAMIVKRMREVFKGAAKNHS